MTTMTVQREMAGQAYARARAETLTPVQAVVMLYDAAINHLNGYLRSLKTGEPAQAVEDISKAQTFVNALASLLNFDEPARGISEGLIAVYEYVNRGLSETDVEAGQTEAALEALRLLTELRDTWAELA